MMLFALALQASTPVIGVPVTAQADASASVTLPQDTPVELMAPAEVSTADAVPGQLFKLRVNKPVEVGGRVVVPVGTPAFGQVVSAVDSGGLGKSGRMTAKLLAIRLGGVEIPLEGEMSAKGTGAGSAGVAVLFTGWVGLFHRGNNAKIKAGELLAGYVARDTPIPLGASSQGGATVVQP
ncbi:MAG: hypothetical protein PGN12_07520 [Sphingomonas phyllosphaerae]